MGKPSKSSVHCPFINIGDHNHYTTTSCFMMRIFIVVQGETDSVSVILLIVTNEVYLFHYNPYRYSEADMKIQIKLKGTVI